jgi:dihydrofolate reductase
MSLDGYVAGPEQSVAHPLGKGADKLHEWALGTRSFRKQHGMDGGSTGIDDDIAAEIFENVGATIMGRHMFGGGTAAWPEPAWNGWWGDDPPFHHPVFVLTHHPRKSLDLRGGTVFHFVTEGIDVALERAKQAAKGKDVSIGGGAKAVQQYLAAGLVDEFAIHVAPLMLGAGERLFENTGARQTDYVCSRVVNSPLATHLSYRRR